MAHFERKQADLREKKYQLRFFKVLISWMNWAFWNVRLPLIYLGVTAADRKRVEAVLDKDADRAPPEPLSTAFSGEGQQQRVAVARQWAIQGKFFADRPTNRVLPAAVSNAIAEPDLNELEGTTVVLVATLNMMRYSRRIVRMLDGQTVLECVVAVILALDFVQSKRDIIMTEAESGVVINLIQWPCGHW